MERSNTDDQRLQPHFQNNLVDEIEEIEEVEMEDLDQEINHLEDESSYLYLSKFDYHHYVYCD